MALESSKYSIESEKNNPDNKKEILIWILEKWFNVTDEESFNSLKKLLKSFNIADLSNYNEIQKLTSDKLTRNNVKFTLTFDKNSKKIYVYPPIIWYFSIPLGSIENWIFKKWTHFTKFDFWYNNVSKIAINDINDLKNELEKPVKNTTNKKEEIIIPSTKPVIKTSVIPKIDKKEKVNSEIEYKVVRWDSLWNIVKKHYNLTDNTDIANCINKLVKYNVEKWNPNKLLQDVTKDKILWDKIYAKKDILLLAPELKFRKQVFSLKK